MNSASELVPLVLLNLKGCPETAAMAMLRKAFGRLCRETGCWRSSFSFEAGATTEEPDGRISLAFAPRIDGSVSRVMRLFLEKADADGAFGSPRHLHPDSYGLNMREGGMRLMLLPCATVAEGDRLTADLELEPPETGMLDEIPQAVAQSGAEAATALASALLAGQPGRPWSDRATAAEQMLEYQAAKRRLLLRLGNGFTGADSRTRLEFIEG